MFFKTRPNLPPNEKAQVEYCFQWIADCIGMQRLQLPVLRTADLVTGKSMEEVVRKVGDHLQHNTESINVLMEPALLEKCGSGG